MSNLEPLNFSLELKEIPVNLKNKAGIEEKYVLVEVTGQERDAYLNNVGNRTKYNKEGDVTGIKTFDGMQSFLLTKSLKKVEEDGERKNVGNETIQSFPSSVVSSLFEAAKDLSDIGKEEDEDKEPGNE